NDESPFGRERLSGPAGRVSRRSCQPGRTGQCCAACSHPGGKTMKSNPVKAALRAGKPQVGTWLTLGSPTAARFLARTGLHWLTVDLEHNPVDWSVAALMFGAIADAGNVPLARVPFNSLENAKRALDAGAFGIVFPMCC